MENGTKKYPSGITEEMVKNAQEKWGEKKVKFAELGVEEDSEETLTVLLRAPNRPVMNEYSKWADKSPQKADEILVNSCLLSHKEQVKTNEYLFGGALDAIGQLIPTPRKAVIKNI